MSWQHTGHKTTTGIQTSGTSIQFADGPSVDAFFRQRVSEPLTVFDSKQIWDDPDLADSVENYPLFFDNQETSGSGTSTLFNVNRASTTLSVSNTTAGTRVRQTRQRFNYQPGKSQVVILTGCIGATSTGITKRIGYFDENNGLFFQSDEGTLGVVIRSSVSGSPVLETVAQDDWNVDKLDGLGISGKLLDITKTQIFFIDFEWLSVGRVRFGFFIDGILVYCHQFLHANDITSAYMSTPNLPIRVEISNDGTGAADSIEHICSTIISEGGITIRGSVRSGNLGALAASEIQCATVDTAYAICGIKLKANYLSATVQEAVVSIIETAIGSDPFLWALHFNPTLTTGLTYTDQSNSPVSFGVGLPAGDILTDLGTIVESGYVSGSLESLNVPLEGALQLGSLIDGTPDELILSVTPLTANQDILGSLTWIEEW